MKKNIYSNQTDASEARKIILSYAPHLSTPYCLRRVELAEEYFRKLFRFVVFQVADHRLRKHVSNDATEHDVRALVLVGPEGLPKVRVLEKARDWKDVWTGVHHDEEEDAAEVKPRHRWILFHHRVHQCSYLLNQYGVKGH